MRRSARNLFEQGAIPLGNLSRYLTIGGWHMCRPLSWPVPTPLPAPVP